MTVGREKLLEAARALLAQHPDREPTTREVCTAAGVGSPTLYHHFGDKGGLIEAVLEDAYERYLTHKRGLPRTGNWVADFEAGWDMHVVFGIRNPVLYSVMYGRTPGRSCSAAQTAEVELRSEMARLGDAGLLLVDVDEAVALTTAMAIGCVTQLIRSGEAATGAVARTMRAALLFELTGVRVERHPTDLTVQSVLARLRTETSLFTAAEAALLRQWLGTLAEHDEPTPKHPGDASPTTSTSQHPTRRRD